MDNQKSLFIIGARNFAFLAALWALNVYVAWQLILAMSYVWRTFLSY